MAIHSERLATLEAVLATALNIVKNRTLADLDRKAATVVVRATAADDDQGTKAAQRQARRPQNLKGQPAKRASRIVGSQSLGNRE